MQIVIQSFPLRPVGTVCHICGNQIFTDNQGKKFCPSCKYSKIQLFLYYASQYSRTMLTKSKGWVLEDLYVTVIIEPMNEKVLGKCEIQNRENNKCVLKINGKYISFASHTLKDIEGRLLYTYIFLHEIFHFIYHTTQTVGSMYKGEKDIFNEEIWVRKQVYSLFKSKYKNDFIFDIILSAVRKISANTDFEMSDFDIRFLSE